MRFFKNFSPLLGNLLLLFGCGTTQTDSESVGDDDDVDEVEDVDADDGGRNEGSGRAEGSSLLSSCSGQPQIVERVPQNMRAKVTG